MGKLPKFTLDHNKRTDRWALVALYEALGHTLAAHRPATFLPYTDLGQLTRSFEAVVGENPELPQVPESVETIDRLRTTFITWGVTRWPVELEKMPGDISRFIARCSKASIRRAKSGSYT